ncbi:hypothetical protein FB45DRAFT_1044051 [Roridomyces roridus]|uniref:Uncharacterized protein n=1 Tax=Roridomyces roridus TaxID=1738132 RepID=A0AAD7AYI1_9AGAR|nr:hypothetical protein FB45DRAFT_1044051 [Roridomyces roridus]
MFPRTLTATLIFAASSAYAAITINTPSGVTSDGSFSLDFGGAIDMDFMFNVELVHNTFMCPFSFPNVTAAQATPAEQQLTHRDWIV